MLDLRDLAHWLIDQVQQHSGRADAFAYRYAPWLERSPVSPLLVLGATFAVLAAVQVLLVSRVPADEAPVSVSIPCPPQAEAGWRGDLLSHPHIRSSGHPDLITAYDPATAYHIADVPADTPPSIAAKLAAAHAAADAWADASFARRRRVLRTLQRWLVTDMESIARVAARDTGKTAIDAAFGELLTTASKLEWTITYGEPVLRPQTRRNNLLLAHKVSRVTHQPLGVVLACVSWNYSAHNALGPIIASLFAGNAVVIKASELVAWSATWYINAVRTCLDACGENKELVQIVTCFPEHAEHLTTSPIVKHITFIGSEAVGRKVAQAAATEITPVTLELGGKDPAVLTASADLKFFASTCESIPAFALPCPTLFSCCYTDALNGNSVGQSCDPASRAQARTALESSASSYTTVWLRRCSRLCSRALRRSSAAALWTTRRSVAAPLTSRSRSRSMWAP